MGALLVIGWYLALPAAVFFDYYQSFPFWDGLNTVGVAWSTGLYFWFCGNLILAAKVPLVERWLPYDRRVRLHMAGGLAVMLALVWHLLTKFIGGMEIDWLSWVLLAGCSLFLALSVAWTDMPLLGRVRAWLGKDWARLAARFYDGLRRVHGAGFAGLVILSWFHIHAAGIDAMGTSGMANAWWLAAVLSVGCYAVSLLRRLCAARGIMSSVEARDGLVVIGVELRRPLRYRAGQFAWLRFPGTPGLGASHPFSFLSAPDPEGADGRSLRFAVKPVGDFTTALAGIPAGSRVLVNGSFGDFRPRPGQNSLLIGTGIGAVPVLSLLADFGDDQPNWQAVLAVGTAAELPHVPKADNVTILEFERDGRVIDRQLLGRLMAGRRDCHVWICSSPRLRRILKTELAAMGVPGRRIHYESFGFD